MSPEKWLKEEASWQLEKIIDALNSAHNMPFYCAWLERDLAMNYLEMLKGMDIQLDSNFMKNQFLRSENNEEIRQ